MIDERVGECASISADETKCLEMLKDHEKYELNRTSISPWIMVSWALRDMIGKTYEGYGTVRWKKGHKGSWLFGHNTDIFWLEK